MANVHATFPAHSSPRSRFQKIREKPTNKFNQLADRPRRVGVGLRLIDLGNMLLPRIASLKAQRNMAFPPRRYGVPSLLSLLPLVLLLLLATSRGAEAKRSRQKADDVAAPAGTCGVEGGQQQQDAPSFFLADDTPGHFHLKNVVEVFQLLGYKEASSAAQATVLWAWKTPFEPHADSPRMDDAALHLSSKFVNQLPGIGYLTTKRSLAELSHSLSFLPRTFQLPQERDEFKSFVSPGGGGAGMEWLMKGTNHRGIQIIPDPAAWAEQQEKEVLVQQLVRPHLIGGHLFDYGVFVAVTSLEPLTAYIFTGSVLLRFCSKPYQRDISAETDFGHYVINGVDDFIGGNAIPILKPHYDDAWVDTRLGSTMGLAVLRAALAEQGINTTRWWLEVQAAVVQMLQRTAPDMLEEQRASFPGKRANFFTLLRFDFMLDETGKNYLIEVNMSPGLFRFQVDRREQLLNRKVVHDLLVLKGLGPGGRWHPSTSSDLAALKFHPDSVAVGESACGGGCGGEAGCGAPRCLLCRACRSEWQSHLLVTVMAEVVSSEGYARVHPPGRELQAHLAAAHGAAAAAAYFDAALRPDDVLVKAWLDRKCEQDRRFC